MQSYNGAFDNTTHPIAVDAQKKAVDGHAAEETTATSSSEEWHFSKLNLISWAKGIITCDQTFLYTLIVPVKIVSNKTIASKYFKLSR